MRQLFAALLLCFGLAAGGVLANCTPDAAYLRGDWGQMRFAVEIADSDETRARGLMYRDRLATSAGMLFVYERSQSMNFWMRNTLIPLDILFIDDTGTITHVHENALPLDETLIPSGGPALLVLEINGGLSARLGISEGSQLRHPAVPQVQAVWPC